MTGHGTKATHRSARRTPTLRVAMSLLAVGGALGGCVSRVTGNEGNLVFSYLADDNLLDFNKAIAVGARLDLGVAEAGSNKAVAVETAGAEPASAMAIVSAEGSKIVLEGKAVGDVLLKVTARVAGGTEVNDSVNLLVRKAEVLRLRHACTDAGSAHYLLGNDVLVPFELERSDGQPVIGYGYYPVDVKPAGAVAIDATRKTQQFLAIKIGNGAASATLQSQIDATTLAMELVAPAAIDGSALDGNKDGNTAYVGLKKLVHVRPKVGASPVCGANTPLQAKTTTPDICSVTALQVANQAQGVVDSWGWLEVDPKQVGVCAFEITWTAGNDGKGVVGAHQIDVAAVRKP